MEDPLPFYKILRDRYPAYWIEQYEAWAISRFEDVWQMLNDPEGRSRPPRARMMFRELLSCPTGAWCPGELRPDRAAVQHRIAGPRAAPPRRRRAAAAQAVQRLEADDPHLARARLDELIPLGRFNLTSEYGGMVAAATMCQMFGLPVVRCRDGPRRGAWSATRACRTWRRREWPTGSSPIW